LQKDAERDLIAPADFAAAQNEMSRRLLDASSSKKNQKPASPLTSVFLAAIVPIIALPLYLKFGTPDLADVPRQARLEQAVETNDFEALVARVEQQLQKTPDDLTGWKILSPAYAKMLRYDESANAIWQTMRLTEPTPDLLSEYGEMLTLANQGIVPLPAVTAFAQALIRDPKHPKARFLSTLALKQEGKLAEAKSGYEALLADAPSNAPWRQAVISELASLQTAKAPALKQEQVAAVTAMSQGDQRAMILSMVDGLETKLAANPGDLDGWQKLIRARSVLGDLAAALAARTKAQAQFKDQSEALATLDVLSAELKLP
jgi:cytochrome c-type biogenesis protein CcmH